MEFRCINITILEVAISDVMPLFNIFLNDLDDRDIHSYIKPFLQSAFIKKSVHNYYDQSVKQDWTKNSFILFTPRSNPQSTVFYAGLTDGWHHLIETFIRHYQIKAYTITINDLDLPAYHFFAYGKNAKRRSVLCYDDGGKWVFYDEGTPLPFERLELYQKRIKKQRFNKDIVLEYLKSAGWDIENELFWQPVEKIQKFEYSKEYINYVKQQVINENQ